MYKDCFYTLQAFFQLKIISQKIDASWEVKFSISIKKAILKLSNGGIKYIENTSSR